jgi:hypothetical protein
MNFLKNKLVLAVVTPSKNHIIFSSILTIINSYIYLFNEKKLCNKQYKLYKKNTIHNLYLE